MLEEIELEKCRDKILNWYAENRENFFFRQKRNPYTVWVSEVFLQQTRINGALKKLENFLQIFPDIDTLASATEDQVLAAFKGMGYYNRARNLLKGAKLIKQKLGVMPDEYVQLKKIPSIGDYTAAAISSICHGFPVLAIDGNIKRIFGRLCKIELEIQSRDFAKILNNIGVLLFKKQDQWSGDINESLMEFGQKICTSKNPNCKACFISESCLSYNESTVFRYPLTAKKRAPLKINWVLNFIIQNDKVLLQKFTDFYFLKNQYGFPSVLENLESSEVICSFDNEDFKINFNQRIYAGPSHAITNHKIKFQFVISNVTGWDTDMVGFVWCTFKEVPAYLISSGLQKTWDSFLKVVC